MASFRPPAQDALVIRKPSPAGLLVCPAKDQAKAALDRLQRVSRPVQPPNGSRTNTF